MAAKWVLSGVCVEQQKAGEVQAFPWYISLGSPQSKNLHLAVGTKRNAFCLRTEEFRYFKMYNPENNVSYPKRSWEDFLLSLDTLRCCLVFIAPSWGECVHPDRGRLSVLHLDPWSLGLCLKHMRAFKEMRKPGNP